MADLLAPENDVAFMHKAQAVLPGIHQDILREKKKKERVLPRSLRRAYRSKDKVVIARSISKAIKQGFTKQEILQGFREYRENEMLCLQNKN